MRRESPAFENLKAVIAATALAGAPQADVRGAAEGASTEAVAKVDVSDANKNQAAEPKADQGGEQKGDRKGEKQRDFTRNRDERRSRGEGDFEARRGAARDTVDRLIGVVERQTAVQMRAIGALENTVAAVLGRLKLPEDEKDAQIAALQEQIKALTQELTALKDGSTAKLQETKQAAAEPSAEDIAKKEAAEKLLEVDRAKAREKYKNKTVHELEALITQHRQTLGASSTKSLRDIYEKAIPLAEFVLEEKKKAEAAAENKPSSKLDFASGTEPLFGASSKVQAEAPAPRAEIAPEAPGADFIPDQKRQAILLKEIEGLSATELNKNMIPYWKAEVRRLQAAGAKKDEIGELQWRIARVQEMMERKKNRTWMETIGDVLKEGEPERVIAAPREKVALAPHFQELKPVSDTGIDTADPSIDFVAREAFSAMLGKATAEEIKKTILPDVTREVRAIDSELNDTTKIRSQDYRDGLEAKMLEASWRREEAKQALKRKQEEKVSNDFKAPVVEASKHVKLPLNEAEDPLDTLYRWLVQFSIKDVTKELDRREAELNHIRQYLAKNPDMNEGIKEAYVGEDEDALKRKAAQLELEIPIVVQVLGDKKKAAPRPRAKAA